MPLVGPYDICPKCGYGVNKGHLQEHLRTTHARSSNQTDQPSRAPVDAASKATEPLSWSVEDHGFPKDLVDCPKCKSKVRNDRMLRHLQHVHGGKPKKGRRSPINYDSRLHEFAEPWTVWKRRNS